MNDEKIITIYAGTETEATLVKHLFDNNDIKCFLKDEIIGAWMPSRTAGGGAGAVKLVIAEKDIEKAKEILEKNEIK